MVIIWGYNGYNTLGLIHCMAENECEFLLLLVSRSKRNFVLLSKYSKNHHVVTTEDEAINYLINNKEALNGSTIIPTADTIVCKLADNNNLLASFYHYPHTVEPSLIIKLQNKNEQLKLAKAAGFNILKTFEYKKGDILPVDVQYPCIIKQLNSTVGYKEKILPCNNLQELKQCLLSAVNTDRFIIQKYIKKDLELLLIGCRTNNGKIYIPAYFQKERWIMNGGDASKGIIISGEKPLCVSIEAVHVFLNKINYVGPFSIEFGLENGIPYFFEINLRNDGTSHYFHESGVYVPYVYYKSEIDKGFVMPDHENIRYTFIDELGDINNVFNKVISFITWYRDLKEARAYKYFCRYDLKPFLAIFMMNIGGRLKKIILKRRWLK